MDTPQTERERMDAHLWYDANFDAELLALRTHADDLCWRFNQTRPSDDATRTTLLDELIPHRGNDVTILPNLRVDYGGEYLVIGEGTFINHDAYLMDGGTITIGTHCFIGPNLGAYTAEHPLIAEQRNRGLERALPIVIGDNVWIGGQVAIMPGVTIGSGAVIGAGSVVTRDIPAGVVAVGSPCKVLRPITEADRIAYLKP